MDFSDNGFDIAFSNSVVEHVGRFGGQVAFSAEIRSVAPRYYSSYVTIKELVVAGNLAIARNPKVNYGSTETHDREHGVVLKVFAKDS